ncbi:MAG: phosphoribosylamine--glycine ligase [Candidatus Moraniibacteriota bacterium]
MDANQTYKNSVIIDAATRGDAFVWYIKHIPSIKTIKIIPGNGGTRIRKHEQLDLWKANPREASASIESIPIQAGPNQPISGYVKSVAAFAEMAATSLLINGPADLLEAGVVDEFIKRGKGECIFGPTRAAAEIEWSKVFAKGLMYEHGIPTAPYKVFDSSESAVAYIMWHGAPIVIKADGLTLGKGCYVCLTVGDALDKLDRIMVRLEHGDAGKSVVIEEYIPGLEFSVHALCDGNAEADSFILLPATQDHKQVHEGNEGPNTGGMGVVCPVPWVTDDIMNRVGTEIILPMLKALAMNGTPFRGCLNPNIILKSDGSLSVADWNARFGDPETPVLMRLMKGDLTRVLRACAEGRLRDVKDVLSFQNGFSVCVMLISEGYPGKYDSGFEITGIEEAEKIPGVVVFYGRTDYDKGVLLTASGRPLCVTAVGETLEEAIETVYRAVERIHFKGKAFRRDIGKQAVEWIRQH